MKKIITFLSVLVMMMAMSATVSLAADNEVIFTTQNKTANSVDVVVSVNTAYTDIETIGLSLNVSDAIAKGATVTYTDTIGPSVFNAAQKVFKAVYFPTDGSNYKSGDVITTIHFTGITEDFEISLMPNSGRTASNIKSAADGDIVAKFGTISTSVTMVEKPTTNEQYFSATVTAQKDSYLEFQFDLDDDDEADLGYDLELGTLTFADGPITCPIKVTGIPADKTLVLKKVIWANKSNNNKVGE